ncbi:hypothetical protein HPB51_005513 [Rhipicephalus microplus]|uniref:Uncharacterized protein n=1 Tax=Rhipicephalus microplus TaxID=6941 RepID=A0A9J6EXX0_RHIMP|nr:hypothetical protein HPB51_005513 [Rhipicephalus microplus]
MATQQGYTTDQGRSHQERQQASRHNRAEHNAQPANGQEDEGSQCDIHDEDAEGLVRGPLMRPIVAQPLFYIPPTNAAVYHYVVPRYDPYVPVVQDHGGLAAPEYIQLVQSSTPWNLYGYQSFFARRLPTRLVALCPHFVSAVYGSLVPDVTIHTGKADISLLLARPVVLALSSMRCPSCRQA